MMTHSALHCSHCCECWYSLLLNVPLCSCLETGWCTSNPLKKKTADKRYMVSGAFIVRNILRLCVGLMQFISLSQIIGIMKFIHFVCIDFHSRIYHQVQRLILDSQLVSCPHTNRIGHMHANVTAAQPAKTTNLTKVFQLSSPPRRRRRSSSTDSHSFREAII